MTSRERASLPWEIERDSEGEMTVVDASGRRLFRVLPAGEQVIEYVLELATDPVGHCLEYEAERLCDHFERGE